MPRRVVITGLGAVSCLGLGAPPLWEALQAGRSGLGPVSRLDLSGFRARLAGEIKDLSVRDHVPKSYRKATKVMARDTEIAVAAAALAVQDAGLLTRAAGEGPEAPRPTHPSTRLGCHIGAGLIAAETLELASAQATAVRPGTPTPAGGFSLRDWGTVPDSGPHPAGGMGNLQPLWMLKYLPNMLACHVTIIHGAEGPSNTITCAEASGLLSLGESRRVIERDDADACFTGGAESKLSLMGVLRYELAGRLADTGSHTNGSSVIRPFDPASPGTLVGEGGGILILEEAGAAAARGVRPYAEVAGFGAAQSPAPCLPTQLAPGQPVPAMGLERAIRAALADAGITPGQVDAIVPQGSGIPAVDAAELSALRAVFADRLARIPLVTLSPYVGDLAAGNAALQACVAALCLREQRLPARLHAGTPPPGVQCGPSPAVDTPLAHVLVCTSSLAGQNAAAGR
jgi:3-oxoacyl-[acyl-carrier-protein] synthase II